MSDREDDVVAGRRAVDADVAALPDDVRERIRRLVLAGLAPDQPSSIGYG